MNPAWQTSCSTLQESVLQLLLSKEFSDVVFTVGENKEKVHAHKLILMARSPVFAAMFSDRWANGSETSEGGDVEDAIPIPDVSTEIFNLFLKYLYTNELSCANLEEATGVLYVAHKYDVNGLEDKCLSVFKAGLAVSNAISLHQFALILDLDDLTKMTKEFILVNAKTVFSNGEFIEAPPDVLAKFLGSDDLCIAEIEAFYALMRWAENRCKIQDLDCTGQSKRQILGDLLYLIRFPVMTQHEFADVVVVGNPGILSECEIKDLFVHFSDLRTEKLPELPFDTNRRMRLASIMPYRKPSMGEQGIVWDIVTRGEWNEQLLFVADRDICITEVEIYPLFLTSTTRSTTRQISLPQDFFVSIEITNSYSQDILGYYRNERFDNSCSERIQFKERTGVRISQDTLYKVQLKIGSNWGGSFITMHQEKPKISFNASVAPRGQKPVNFRLARTKSDDFSIAALGQIKAIHFCSPNDEYED